MIERLVNLLHRHARPAAAVYWAVLVIATHWPHLDLGGNDLGGVVQFDKLIHVAAFGLLTLLLMLALRPRAAAALLIAAGYALIDEYTQRWTGRVVSWSDLTASLIGVTGAFVVWKTPAHAAVSARRGWRIITARAMWILAAPTLALLVTLPASNWWIGQIVAWIVAPQRGTDKWLHLWVSMGLTWLLAAGSPAGRRRPRLGAVVTILLMGGSAPLIELVQQSTGRGFEVADVFAHELGLLLALAGWAAVLAWNGRWPRRRPVEAGAAEGSFVGHAVVVSALTLLSRVTGLVRDAVLAAVFGLGPVSDAFFVGFLVPNLFRRLFGEGALSAAFIPHYTQLLERDPKLARRFASLCLTLLTVLLCALTVIGELLLWWMESLGPGESLPIRLTMLMLPYMPLICLVALIGGVLQVHRRFGPPAAAPVVLNLTMIAATLWAAQGLTTDMAMRQAAVVVAISVVTAGVLQLLWQVAVMLRHAPLEVSFAGTGPSFRSMLAMMLPMVVGLAVFQINAFMDTLIAIMLSRRPDGPEQLQVLGWAVAYPMESGAVAALQWAQRLYQFPLGVFGIAIATAIFPALSRAADARPQDAFAQILRQGLRLTVFIGLPASVGILMLRLPLARVVYERGAFTLDDAQRVATILAGYSTSIWAYSMTHVLTRGFYALKDSKTPLRISVVMVGFNLALNMILVWPLGAAGLAWSTAISAMGQVALLLAAIRRRVPEPIDDYVLRGWARTAALSAAMAAALLPFVLLIDLSALTTGPLVGLVAGLVLLGAAIMFGGAWLTGAQELAWLRRRRGALSQ